MNKVCDVKGCRCVGTTIIKRLFGNSITESILCKKHAIEYDNDDSEKVTICSI